MEGRRRSHKGEMELDNLIIRDATPDEKEELRLTAEETVNITVRQNQEEPIGRCSLLQMTPRHSDSGGFTDREEREALESQLSQLSGLKPRALEF